MVFNFAASTLPLRRWGLAVPSHAQSKLKAVAVTVGDLGNPFFVQIAHGALTEGKKTIPSVKFTGRIEQLRR
jgi:ABC-type sugar transport system substrate-binding protein